MSKQVVYQRTKKSKAGGSNAEDEPHSGRPNNVLNKATQCGVNYVNFFDMSSK